MIKVKLDLATLQAHLSDGCQVNLRAERCRLAGFPNDDHVSVLGTASIDRQEHAAIPRTRRC